MSDKQAKKLRKELRALAYSKMLIQTKTVFDKQNKELSKWQLMARLLVGLCIMLLSACLYMGYFISTFK